MSADVNATMSSAICEYFVNFTNGLYIIWGIFVRASFFSFFLFFFWLQGSYTVAFDVA